MGLKEIWTLLRVKISIVGSNPKVPLVVVKRGSSESDVSVLTD